MPVWRREHELSRVMIHYMGIVTTAICVSAILGQVTNQPYLYAWGHYGAMSLPTATVCTSFGIGFFMVSRGEAPHDNGGQ